MGRFDIREATTLDRRPEPGRERRPDRTPERPGHRRNYGPLQQRQNITERMNAAVADVGQYRVLALTDLVRERFGGNPFAARKAINRMKADGLVTERTLHGPKGGAYRVLSPTTHGARRAVEQARRWELDPEQRAWDHPGSKTQDMAHDVAIYRAARIEQARIEERGARLWRVRIDAELKAEINSRSEAVRARRGPKAARREREKAAEDFHLPVRNGQVQYPDAQLEFLEPGGLTRGHVNIEVVSGNYAVADIAAKAAARFQMHGDGSRRAGERITRAQELLAHAGKLARSASRDGGGGGGGQRGKGVVEL